MIFDELLDVCHSLRKTGVRKTLHMKLADLGIRISCVGFEPEEIMFSSIKDLFCDEEGGSFEDFFCFEIKMEDLIKMLPEETHGKDGRTIYDGEKGRFVLSVEHGFFSLYSNTEDITYICLCPDKRSLDEFISHPFHMELGWWALRKGMFFLHSACIGKGDAGILISGAGGSGKSTLSMSALLCGMDFLSDDYVLIRNKKRPEALRIYSTSYLKKDVLEMMEELKEDITYVNEEREKCLISLDRHKSCIKDVFELGAVVIPHIVHREEPLIEENRDLRKLLPLLASTSYQNRELRNKEVFTKIMALFRELKSYDLWLSDDIMKNAEYLKERMGTL